MAPSTNNNRKRKWIFLGLGLLSAGLSLFGYNYWKKNKQKTSPEENAPDFKAEKPKSSKSSTPKKNSSTKAKQAGPPPKSTTSPKPGTKPQNSNSQAKPFPLKMGDKNSWVKYFQLGLIKRYGKSILPKFGADGSFGNELANAIRKIQKLSPSSPVSITEKLYKSIVATKVLSGVEPSLIITRMATKVWKDPRTAVAVPVNMVLGQQICQRGSFTLFESDKQYFLVETASIMPYKTTN